MMRTAVLLLAAALPLAPLAPAAEAPPRPERQLTIDDVVFLTLKRNLGIAAERINPKRADTVVVEQMAVFDPTAYGELTRSQDDAQRASATAPRGDRTTSGTLGVAKAFPLGTTLDLKAQGAHTRSGSDFADPNPVYDEATGLSLTQPLLRGFGIRVNTAGIATARNERRIAQAKLRQVALDTVSDAKKIYWELVYAIRNRELLQRSLDRALNLQRDVQARVDAKVLGERDPSVAQARAEVSLRQEDIVVADQAIHDAEDALKTMTDLAANPAIWQVALVPSTEPPATVPALDPEGSVQTALLRRPDYLQAQIFIENQDIVLYVRRNELLPKLDLKGTFGYSGLGGSFSEADHRLGTLDYETWSLGLSMEYPLGNRAARARHRRAELELRQAKVNRMGLERQVQLEVRNATRQVFTNAGRRRAAEASVRAEEERLRAEEIRFREARVGTSQDVLDAQAALAQAESRSLRALIDLNRAIVDTERVKGTLLDSANVIWEEEDEGGPQPAPSPEGTTQPK